MKITILLSYLASSAALVSASATSPLDRRDCAGNNCNRAITGTRSGLPATSLRRADCASFLSTAVTPSAITTTTWVESSSTLLSGCRRHNIGSAGAVTVVPSVLPTYATNCVSAAAYASACSCWGVTGTVSTAPTPTVTVTSTFDMCDM